MKKRILAMLVIAMMLFSMIPVSAETAGNLTDIYVATTGDDQNAGTEDAPVLSLNKALELVENGGTVHIVDSFTAASDFVWESHNKDVTITGGKLDLTAAYAQQEDGNQIRQCFGQGDAVTFDNLEIVVVDGGFYFANGNRLQINENVTITGSLKLFGGSYRKNVAATNVTLLGGSYASIYGGGYKGHVTGDINLYVGNVNPNYTATHDGSTLLYGGGYNCNVYGDINLTVNGANVDFAYGSSHNSGTISGDIYVKMAGGNLYSLYAGGSGTIKGDINLSMTGGTVAQVFGAHKKANYTGNVSVMLKAGTITRRFFGGCYNDYDVLGDYENDTYVNGNIDVFLYEGMNLNWNTSEKDLGFFAHSRHNPLFAEEVTHLYYMSAEAKAKHEGNVGSVNSGMILAMGSATVADEVSVYEMSTKVNTWNIILGDDIGARFYVELPKVIADLSQMKITVADKTEVIDLSACETNAIGQYMIPVHVAAAQMTEKITLQLVIDGVACDSISYTVQEYAKTILTGDYEPEMKALVQSMLSYGAAAQQYFQINTDNLANTGYEQDYTAQLPEGYNTVAVDGQLSGVTFYGASLVFKSRIALRYYFNAESLEGVSFTANGETYTAKEKNGMYYVEIPGINPQAYSQVITLCAAKGEETLSVGYSPMHYMVRMLNSGDEALKGLMNAMYGYHEAAFGYVEEDEDLSDLIDWTSVDTLPNEEGKYRLTAPVTVSGATTTAKYAEIYLDLNGFTVTGTNNTRIYVLDEGSNLTITDNGSGVGSIVCNRESTGDAGAIYLKGKNSVLNLEGGMIDASNVTVKSGAAVYVAAGATFNMNDGTITGGTATGNGGSVYVQAATNDVEIPGKFYMNGGSISAGTATQGGNIYVAAGSDTKAAAEFTMDGGVISDGEATATAGNVAALGVFAMNDGTITDGVCLVSDNNMYASNIYTLPGKNGCSFVMMGGTITGGVRVNNDGAITLGGSAKIVGGTTGLTFSKGSMVTIGFTDGAMISVNHTEIGVDASFGTTGKAGDEKYIVADNGKLVSATEDGKLYLENITLWTSTDSLPTKSGSYRLVAPVNVSTATTTGAVIYLDLNGQTITGTNGNRIYVLNDSAELTIDDTTGGGQIICVREHTDVAGAIYLNKPGAVFNFNGGTIDASGVTVKSGTAVYVKAGNTFNMNGGTIIGGTATENGGSVYVQAATNDVEVPGKFYMNGGTIMSGKAAQGGNIYVAAGSDTKAAAVFAMDNGVISGGEATTTAGNVAALGEFTMTAGTISGGICDVDGNHKYAANVYTLPGKNGCTFTMLGGTIEGGVRVNNAGTITLGGTAKIVGGKYGLTFSAGTMVTTGFSEGAEISVNTIAYGVEKSFGTVGVAGDETYIVADNGNYIGVTEDGKLFAKNFVLWTSTDSLPTKSGRYGLAAPVELAKAASMAENAQIYLDLNGQTITGKEGIRIYVLNANSVLTIDDTASGGKIICTRENTDAEAGVFFLKSAGAQLNLNGGTIDATGVTVKYGAAVYVAAGTTFNMNGGTIMGGGASETGGNIYVQAGETAGVFNMNGGTISGGHAKQGGNVYVAAGSDTKAAAALNLYNGTISGGEATTTGGNVAALGVFYMADGTITGGTCKADSDHKYATNIYTLPGKNGCTFTMLGGEITGGIRVNNAGNMTLGGTARITQDSNGYGMFVSTNGTTILVDEETPLTAGAEIWLAETGKNPIVKGNIAEAYQGFFHYCGEGTLSFDENGIHVVAVAAVVLDNSNNFALVSSKNI